MTKLSGDLKKLQGSWVVIAAEVDGARLTFGGSKIVIEEDHFTTVSMGGDYSGTMTVASAAKPKTFDVLFTNGPHKGEKSLGIYKLSDDTWTICMGLAGVENRPKEFATSSGTGFALETLQRENLAESQVAAESTADPPTEFEGEWTMISGSMDGHAMQAGMVKTGRRISHGNQLTVLFGGQVFFKARWTVDAAKAPKHIEYVVGSPGSPAQLGIYELSEGRLTICMAPAGQPRPAEFATKKGDGRSLTAWKPVP